MTTANTLMALEMLHRVFLILLRITEASTVILT